jgi:hypothetical protein
MLKKLGLIAALAVAFAGCCSTGYAYRVPYRHHYGWRRW